MISGNIPARRQAFVAAERCSGKSRAVLLIITVRLGSAISTLEPARQDTPTAAARTVIEITAAAQAGSRARSEHPRDDRPARLRVLGKRLPVPAVMADRAWDEVGEGEQEESES